MRRIDRSFLLLATLSLLIGVSLGIWMGIVHDFQMTPVHAHMNLVGWVSLALFGLTYRAYPEMAASKLAVAHFVLASVAAFLLPIGIALTIIGVTVSIAIAASFMWLAAVLLFLINLVRVTIASLTTEVTSGALAMAPPVPTSGQWRESL